jgi:membrane protein implicated in regulation of membrane protease activity
MRTSLFILLSLALLFAGLGCANPQALYGVEQRLFWGAILFSAAVSLALASVLASAIARVTAAVEESKHGPDTRYQELRGEIQEIHRKLDGQDGRVR